MPRGKAAGPDGIPNEVLSVVGKIAPTLLLSTKNKCLIVASLPVRWKNAKLVLLNKGQNQPVTNPSCVCPLCMLDTAGKDLERIILTR